MPPPWVTQTASQIQSPRTSAASPTIEPMSGVNENMPLIAVARSMRPASGGQDRDARLVGLAEVLRCERLDRGHRLARPRRPQPVWVEQDRLVPVVAEP